MTCANVPLSPTFPATGLGTSCRPMAAAVAAEAISRCLTSAGRPPSWLFGAVPDPFADCRPCRPEWLRSLLERFPSKHYFRGGPKEHFPSKNGDTHPRGMSEDFATPPATCRITAHPPGTAPCFGPRRRPIKGVQQTRVPGGLGKTQIEISARGSSEPALVIDTFPADPAPRVSRTGRQALPPYTPRRVALCSVCDFSPKCLPAAQGRRGTIPSGGVPWGTFSQLPYWGEELPNRLCRGFEIRTMPRMARKAG
jgi:hypothetical protein